MPTYEYETIPTKAGQKPVCFEVYQPITATALTHHPETGAPVRRVISGGLGIFTESRASEGPSPCAMGGCEMAEKHGGCQGGTCGL